MARRNRPARRNLNGPARQSSIGHKLALDYAPFFGRQVTFHTIGIRVRFTAARPSKEPAHRSSARVGLFNPAERDRVRASRHTTLGVGGLANAIGEMRAGDRVVNAFESRETWSG